MYIDKYTKDGRVYFGFFSDVKEYPSSSDIPMFIRSGELSPSDLKEAESLSKSLPK